ncbi:MAG: hypothetical protein QME13_05055 [Thermoanaerobacteraceae bacterium]|jgi:hypothetical protein|nr:hypothetical protein [Thermoanaerobacteraceae bacterium]
MRDTIVLGLVGGLIGNAAKDLSNFLIYRAGKTELLYGHYAASMISAPEEVREKGHFVAGQVVDMVIGAILGVPIVLLFKKTGKDNHLLKGAGLGLLLWEALYAVGPNLGILSVKPHMAKTHFSALWSNLLYGVTTAQAIVSLADPGLFPDQQRRRGFSPSVSRSRKRILLSGKRTVSETSSFETPVKQRNWTPTQIRP